MDSRRDCDHGSAPQIFGHDPPEMRVTARLVTDNKGICAILLTRFCVSLLSEPTRESWGVVNCNNSFRNGRRIMKFREHIPIGTQIALLPALALIGFAAVLFLQYEGLGYQQELNKSEVARLDLMDGLRRFQRQMTDVRVSEKNFFAHHKISDTVAHKAAEDAIFRILAGLSTEHTSVIGKAQLDQWTRMLKTYQDYYDDAARELEIIGYTENVGLRGSMRTAIHSVESRIKYKNPVLMRDMLEMRRHEKDFIIRGEDKFYTMWEDSIGVFQHTLGQAHLSDVDRAVINLTMPIYVDSFRAMVEHKRDLVIDGGRVDDLSQRIMKSINLALVKASVHSRSALERKFADARSKFLYIAAFTFLIGVVTVMVSRWIGGGLRGSLTLITNAMTRLTKGDLNARIPATSYANEIGQMAKALRVFRENDKRRLLADINLRRAKRQTENIIQSMHEALFEIDRDGTIKTSNAAAERLLGLSMEELIGQNLARFFIEHGTGARASGLRGIDAIIKPEDTRGTAERTMIKTDGRAIMVSYSWAQMLDDVDGQTEIIVTVRDISEQQKAKQEILQFKRTLDQSDDEVYLFWADDFRIFYQNRSACRLTGWTVDEYSEKTVMDFNPDFDPAWFKALVAPLISGEESQIMYERVEHRTNRPVEVAIEYVTAKDGFRPYFVAFVRDISERKAADRAKSEFVSTVSHELRTPLTSIKGALGIIAADPKGELAEGHKKLVSIALTNSDRLARLINDILDFEKIEAGMMEYRMEPMDLSALVSEALQSNEGYAQTYGVHFVAKGTEAPVMINGDRDRLMQVLSNLMSNAAKFSDKGADIEVSLSSADGKVRVAVKDSGAGIPEAAQATIFDKFTQADSSDQRKKGGTGLGLNIVKSMVEAHGGTIAFDSKEGVGTTFYFDLALLQDVADEEPGRAESDTKDAERPDIAAQ